MKQSFTVPETLSQLTENNSNNSEITTVNAIKNYYRRHAHDDKQNVRQLVTFK